MKKLNCILIAIYGYSLIHFLNANAAFEDIPVKSSLEHAYINEFLTVEILLIFSK